VTATPADNSHNPHLNVQLSLLSPEELARMQRSSAPKSREGQATSCKAHRRDSKERVTQKDTAVQLRLLGL